MSIPEKLISSISSEERFLYISDELKNIGLIKHKRNVNLLLFFGTMIIVLAIAFSFAFPSLIDGEIDMVSLLLFLSLPSIVILGFVCIYNDVSNLAKSKEYVAISDKNLYIYRYYHRKNSDTVDKINLKNIYALIYGKIKYNKKTNNGNLTILQNKTVKHYSDDGTAKEYWNQSIHFIRFIPEILQFQRILESILYQF
ncbi:MAG: hypothetical protein GF317_12675 [Candidatus Lokiarchaeota archaeon]|nr:hypothetical protein [Candidatus Lokiarchaeota archaeon]MBD3200502.1 hypothetical protein [Candidatus Lokiarchaeota archaeon]